MHPIPLMFALLACTDTPSPAAPDSADDAGALDSAEPGRDTADTSPPVDTAPPEDTAPPIDTAPPEDTGDPSPWTVVDGVSTTCLAQLSTMPVADTSGDRARIQVDVEIPAGARGVQVDLATDQPGARPFLVSIKGPAGNTKLDYTDWWSTDQLLTAALYPYNSDVAARWPVRAEDGPLTPGTWRLTFGTTDDDYAPLSNVPLVGAAWLIEGPEEAACVQAHIVTAAGIDADPALMSGLEEAVQRWAEVLADRGVILSARWSTSTLDPALPAPGDGHADYTALRAAGHPSELIVVVGESIGGDTTNRLGQAANIPGPLAALPRGVVAVNWLLHAGSDGVVDGDDARWLGETMAHEGGHYMGLVHPVDFTSEYTPASYDALSDTPRCDTWEECAALMGDNLMFPWAWCRTWGECSAQDALSVEQEGVLLRSSHAL